jgi:hypothetical protein
MSISALFGYLCFALSIVFGGIQLLTLLASEHLEAVPLILFFAAVCLLLASLTAQSSRKTATTVIAVIAFTVCFMALLAGDIMAMKSGSGTAPIKYGISLVYAISTDSLGWHSL